MSSSTKIALPKSMPTWGKRLMRIVLWTTAVLFGIAMFIAVAIAWIGSGSAGIASLQSWLTHLKPYAYLVHLGLLGCLWWKWEALITYLYATGRMHPAMKEAALASRNRTMMLLLAVEIFVVMGFPFSMWD